MRNNELSILQQISPQEALSILKILAEEDQTIAVRIEQIFRENILIDSTKEDIDEIADSVCSYLEFIDVEDVWHNSGSTRDGYVDPHEYAWSLYEDRLQEYLDELKRHKDMSTINEVKYYCMGILKGIYLFETESSSEFKDWAADAGMDNFFSILDDWKKDCQNKEDIVEMNNFIQENCPKWYRD